MAVIVTRAGKGSPLTNAEVDANFTNLNAGRFETIPVVVNAAAPTPPPAPASAGTAIQVVGVTGVSPLIENNGFGIQGQFTGRRANGSAAAPTPINSGDILAVFNARGYDANGWAAGPSASLVMVADENFTATGHGAELQFYTTKIGTNAQIGRWQVGHDGNIVPFADSFYDIGQAALRVRSLFGTTGDFSGSIYSGDFGFFTKGIQIGNNAYAATINCVRYNGTAAAPTAVKAWDALAVITAQGRGATTWGTGSAAIYMETPADWTDASMPGHINIQTTPVGSNAIQNRWQFNNAGNILPFTDSAYDIGAIGLKVRNIFGCGVDLAGPNAILTLHGRTGAGVWGIYSSDGTKLQFWNGATDVATLGSTGNLTLNGNLQANVVSAAPSAMMAMSGQAGINSVLYFDAVTPGKLGAWVYQFPSNILDLDLGGVHVAAFNPADQSLTVDGTLRGFAVTATSANSGSAVLNPGGPANSGYLAFFDPANTRIGYIGFGDTATKTLNFAAEAGYAYRFGQGFSTAGEITFGASFDLVEPRGRYWARPAPSGNYTLALADAGSFVVQVSAAPSTITIPPQSAVAWKSWTRIDILQYSAGQVTFAPGVGVSLSSSGGKRKTTGQFSVASLIQINPDEWLLVGDLAL